MSLVNKTLLSRYRNRIFFLKIVIFNYVYVCVSACRYVHMRPEVADALEMLDRNTANLMQALTGIASTLDH